MQKRSHHPHIPSRCYPTSTCTLRLQPMVRCAAAARFGVCLLALGLAAWHGLPNSAASLHLQQIAAKLAVRAEPSEAVEPVVSEASEATTTSAAEIETTAEVLRWPSPETSSTSASMAPTAAPLDPTRTRPGKCAAEFLEPPCEMFKMIRYGMSNWRDKEVRQGQVDLETSFTKDDKKEALVGSFGGRLYLVYRERPERMRDSVVWFEVLDLLAELTAQVQLDVEFVIHTSDVPMVEKSADKVCGHKDRFVFSVSGGPLFCDVALGPGVRGTSLLRAGDDLRKSDIPYEQKINLGFWRGAPWPARRCGSWKRSPRILMPKASLQHPDVLNASLSTLDCGDKEPQDLCREVKTLKAQRVSWLEQLRYRFLLTSAPKCTYTGRVYPFAASNSVVAMFSNGRHGVSQAIYAALQDNVHVKLVHEKAFVEEIRSMQASWRELAALPPRAQSVYDWATSSDVRICYMYELLRSYRTKLAYKPSSDGTIARLLKTKTSSCGHQSYKPGSEMVRADKGRRSYCVESWPVPSNASAMGEAAFAKWCAQVQARAPKF
eukprot:s2313_g5.t3